MNKKLDNTLQSYCDRLNKYLPCSSPNDIFTINDILDELYKNVEGSTLYWDRQIYIDSNFDLGECRYILTHSKCYFVPINDIEHTGVKVIYKYEK